jgi:DNA-binding MarR family transcriptional regulator
VPSEETVAEQLATLLRAYRKAMAAALTAEDYGPIMPAATWLLLAMDREPGTVGDLGRRLGLTKQAVSRLADRLVILGYCDRQRSETNRRQVLLQVTGEGARAAGALRRGISQADAQLLAGLGRAGREAFRETLAGMVRAAGGGDPAPAGSGGNPAGSGGDPDHA